ncbi:MAG: hypothetical protein IPG04_33755 [Polyangiaceae bacterium]|nr:hypothetical protein [Polyangiaceae bacterium]
MMGPQSQQRIHLKEETAPAGIAWLTGLKATMVGADGETLVPPEYMCHSNLDVDPIEHEKIYGHALSTSGRLFTLSQGQLDVQLPPGFGIPVRTDQKIDLTTQVLNLNHHGEPMQVRHHVEMSVVPDGVKPMKPLFMAGVYGLHLLKGDHGVFGEEKPKHEGSACTMGKAASNGEYVDQHGKEFTGHWIVKPGREVSKTRVTTMMSLPFDTTIHHIAVHLHPFAESLKLVDLTTGTTVYEAKTRQLGGKIGLEHVDSFSSVEGIPVFKDHEYELVSVYNNTTDVDQDSMAVLLLYMLDKEFSPEPKPAPAPKKRASR